MNQKGIDVSTHQGVIDWKQVKASGIGFAIIRTGYGDTLENPSQIDKQFHNNMKGAATAGIPVGVYHFSYAGTPAEARQEAKTGKPGKIQLTDITIAFLEEIRKAGYVAGIYTNLDFIRNRFDMSRLQPYEMWLAHYNREPGYPCGLQQTTDAGTVPGISGKVDLDIAWKEYGKLKPDVSWDTASKQLKVGESYAALCTCRNYEKGANVRSDNPDVVEITGHNPGYTTRKGETGELYTIRGLKPGTARIIASIPNQDSASFEVKVV